MSYDVTVPFTDEEIDQIYAAGCTIGEFRDCYQRFPDQDFVTALGGCVMEKQHKAEGATIPLDSSLQEIANEVPTEPENIPEDSKLPEPTSTDV